MKNKKKAMALLMCLILCVTIFSACLDVNTTNQKTAESYIQDYFYQRFAKMVDEYAYSQEAKAAITEEVLKESYEAIVGPLGMPDSVERQKDTPANRMTYLAVFRTGSLLVNVVFNEKNEIAGFFIEPYDTLTMPATIVEREIKFGEQKYLLTGTLTTPKDKESKTVVILVAGSGPADRNESLGVLKPFRDIAWGLAEQDISVFRYDKRTYTYKEKLAQDESLTVNEEVIDDVTYAYYKMHALGYDNIYILGHSFGGHLMGRIAKELPWAKGYIIMAGNVTPIEELMVSQIKYLAEFDGKVSEEEAMQIQQYEAQKANIQNLTKENASSYSVAELMGAPAAYWLDLKGYNPFEIAKCRGKLLVLQGANDYQVTTREYGMWQSGLAEHKNVTFKLYDKLNHLFMPSKVMNASDYRQMNYVDGVVLKDIAAFVSE